MKLETLEAVTAALAAMRTERIHQQSITAELNAELAKAKNRHEPEIQKHATKEKELAEAVQAYFDEHRAELLPGKLKSTKLEGHAIGYRANGGAISFTKKSGGAKKVLEALKAAGGKLSKLFIRTTEAVDKAAMKDEWESYGEELAALGVRLTEEELFFIELDMEGNPKA